MYWPYGPYYGYYGYPYYYPYMPPMPMPDPFQLMAYMGYWMIYPYYYALTLELYRVVLDTWRKSFEMMARGLGGQGIQ